jgi:hypothetical protein
MAKKTIILSKMRKKMTFLSNLLKNVFLFDKIIETQPLYTLNLDVSGLYAGCFIENICNKDSV